MSPARTTLIVILLAGDEATVKDIDPLLQEIQKGLDGWGRTDPPCVFCMYHRWDDVRRTAKTFQFQIEKDSLKFGDPTWNLTEHLLRHATQLTGDIADQLPEFLQYVRSKLPDEGPIRGLIGAHGSPGLGFDPVIRRELLKLLKLLLQLLSVSGDDGFSSRFDEMLGAVPLTGSRYDGFAATATSRDPALTLNRAASAIGHLPERRLQSLILHTCSMSSVEAISALQDVPHHIACETDMTPYMHLADWFSVLGDPSANPSQLTSGCFQSLQFGESPSSVGCFSSHLTHYAGELLDKLDELGAYLHGLIKPANDPIVAQKIRFARNSADVSIYTADLAKFCVSLERARIVPCQLVKPIVDTIEKMQLGLPLKNNGWEGVEVFIPYRGISVYFPNQGIGAHSTTTLPDAFQSAARRWCKFMDAWITS